MIKKLNITYFILSLVLYAVVIFFWGLERVLFGQFIVSNIDLLLILFLVLNYVYLGRYDFLKGRSLYRELTKNLVLVMMNFMIVVFTLLIINGIVNQETVVQLDSLSCFELLLTGLLFIAVSISTHHFLIKKGWK